MAFTRGPPTSSALSNFPSGEHTLHIEAAGFEPSDIIVKFDQPGVQSLNVELKHLTASAKPAPRP